jgi:hypothetical protein
MTGLGGPDGGGLIVSGGGTTMVATDALLAQAALVRLLHAEAEGWQARLARIRSLDGVPAPSWTPADPGLGVFAAERAIDAVEVRSRELADALVAAAEGYGEAERNAEMFARLSGAWLGYTLGRLWPVILAAAGPALTGAAAAWLLGSLTGTGPDTPPADVAGWLHDNPRALTNPAVVAAVRVIVSSMDDTAAGVVGLPLPLSLALGDDGAGLLGVISSAAGALALARPLGLLRETPVTVAQVGAARAQTPPAGLEDLAARVPAASQQGPQVRIERYGDARNRAWVVYIGGTVDWNPTARAEPWDVTSNVAAVADRRAGSFRAVLRSMREAGVRPGDPVIQVGHSQGGLIAAQVAASGAFNTVAVATFGAPSAQVPVVAGVPTLSVEHADDLVPALAGSPAGVDARLVVRREVYAGADVPASQALPAHSLTNYRETARLIDASPEPRLRDFRARLESVVGTLPGESTSWRATRIPASVVGWRAVPGRRAAS